MDVSRARAGRAPPDSTVNAKNRQEHVVWAALMQQTLFPLRKSADGGIRTPTWITRTDPKSAGSAIPPVGTSCRAAPGSSALGQGLSRPQCERFLPFANATYRTYHSEQETGSETGPKQASLLLEKGVFFRLHSQYLAEGKEHAGMLLARQQHYSVGEQMPECSRSWP